MATDKNIENQIIDEELVDGEEILDGILEEKPDDKGTFIHEFKKPFTYDGITWKRMEFDFESMTGNDMRQIHRELEVRGILVAAPAFNIEFQIRFACRACKEKIGTDVLNALPVRDFNAIVNKAKNFLLRSE